MQKTRHKLQSKSKLFTSCHNTLQSHDSQIQTFQFDFPKEKDNCLNQGNIRNRNQQKDQNTVHLQIQLDDGKIQAIFPSVDDDPFTLAKQFCQTYQLDDQMFEILAQNIKKTIQKLKKNSESKKSRIRTLPNQIEQLQLKLSKQCSTKQLTTKKSSLKKPNLYERCVQQENTKRSWIEKQKNLKSSKQLIQCTYSPKINSISEEICNLKQNYVSNKTKDLYQSINTQISMNHQDYVGISEGLKFDTGKQNKAQSVFDYLYEESKTKQLKNKQNIQAFFQRNYNFQPEINTISRRIIGNKSFQERLKSSTKKPSSLRLKTLPQQSNEPHSFKTSSTSKKQYFSPLSHNFISKKSEPKSHLVSKKAHLSSQDLICSQNRSKSKRLNELPRTHQALNQKLYEKQKQSAFQKVFDVLDEDKDGKISILKINLINNVEKKLIQILFPVLEQLQILETQLNLHQFSSALNNLFKSLSVQEKAYILKYQSKGNSLSSKQTQFEAKQQKSQMTPISIELVNQTQRKHVSVYQYSKIREQLKRQKLEQQRIQKERILMRNCTFHPKVNPKKVIYF